MKNIIRCLITSIITMMPIVSFSTVIPLTKLDCAALAMPKTVLLVHASWCSHCKAFMPTYKKVSDQEKYKDWTFYEIVNEKFEKVCGTSITAIPITFKYNMRTYVTGNKSQLLLESFLDN